jgi:hypothetical protein
MLLLLFKSDEDNKAVDALGQVMDSDYLSLYFFVRLASILDIYIQINTKYKYKNIM